MGKSLPKGWVETSIKVVSEIIRGVSYKKEQASSDKFDDSAYVIRGGNIQDNKIDFNTDDNVFVGKLLINKSQFVKENDVVIVGSTGSKKLIGKAGIATQDLENVSFGAFLMLLRTSVINKKYHSYFFQTKYYRNSISELAGGVNINNIRKEYLENLIFPLPPLAEQERIVAKLDKLFAQHEKIKKALDRIPQLLKSLRQQVLSQAVTGKLTEQWREGKELGEWEKRLVKEITIKLGSGSTPRGGSATYLSEGIPLVRSMNVVFGGIKLDGLAFINEVQAAALKNVEIHFEDILLNITGASIGRLCLADKTVTGGRVNQHVFIIRTDRESIFPQFMEIYLRSNLIQGFIEEIKYGAGMEAISKSQIENLEINTPSLQEQQEIVRRVESLFTKADAIEERYKKLKEKIHHLPQAMLHKAFKGELVPQLPTDGDAKDLLAEIMALKEEVKGRKNKT